MQKCRLLPSSVFGIAAALVLIVSCFTPVCAASGPEPAPAPTPTPTPKPCAVPARVPAAKVVINWKYDPDGNAVACFGTTATDPTVKIFPAALDVTPTIHRFAAAEKGIAIDFSAKRKVGPFYGYRATDGVRFLNAADSGGHAEDRLAFVVRPNGSQPGTHPFVVYLNAKGRCFVDGPETASLHATCHGVVRSPKDDAKKIGGKDDELATICPALQPDQTDTFCGRVVATWPLLQDRLRVGPIGQPYEQDVKACAAFSDHDLSTAELESCADELKIAQADEDRFRGTIQADTGSQSGNGGSSAAGDTTSGHLRSPRAVAAAPAASATPNSTTGTLLGGTAVFPIHHAARASVTVDKFNLSSILDRLQQNASASAQTAIVQAASRATQTFLSKPLSVGCDGKCPDDSFKKLDVGVFDVIPNPFRSGVETKFADYQVDLKPVDFSTVTNVNYGGKFILSPLDARIGLAWYRDIDAWASGSAVHADRDFGPFVLGITHTVANIDPSKVTNPYQVDKAHTANTVVGAVARFFNDQSLQLYGRYGFLGNNSGARDMLGVLTYSPNEIGSTVNRAGSYWKPFAALGYRVIDAGYDPLGTSYDEFTGTKSLFATAGYRRVAAGPSESDPQIELSATAVRAWDDLQPRYNALTLSASAKFGAGTSSPVVSVLHTRSNIASSVFARQAPGVLVTDADEARTLLRNDSDTVNVKINSGVFTFSAGPAWTDAPKKCDASKTPKCAASYNRQLSYELSADQPAFAVDVKAGLAPATQAAFGQKSVASNQLDAKAVGSYSNWCFRRARVQPAATFDTNVAENRSSYVPGKLFEARVDISGGPTFQPVLRLSYKVVNDQFNPVQSPASLSTHAFYAGVTIDSASRQFQAHCQADSKASKK